MSKKETFEAVYKRKTDILKKLMGEKRKLKELIKKRKRKLRLETKITELEKQIKTERINTRDKGWNGYRKIRQNYKRLKKDYEALIQEKTHLWAKLMREKRQLLIEIAKLEKQLYTDKKMKEQKQSTEIYPGTTTNTKPETIFKGWNGYKIPRI